MVEEQTDETNCIANCLFRNGVNARLGRRSKQRTECRGPGLAEDDVIESDSFHTPEPSQVHRCNSNGHWDLGAEAAAAGPTGEAAGTASTGWKAPVLSYSNGSGAFAGMDVGGSKIGTDTDKIESVYGEGASFQSILAGQVQTPSSASEFTSALQQVAK